MFSYKFKVENRIYFPFRLKKDLSNMTYGDTDMTLHKASNQRTYKKIFIILHHGNLPIMHICLYISKRTSYSSIRPKLVIILSILKCL